MDNRVSMRGDVNRLNNMERCKKQFLGIEVSRTSFNDASVIVIPFCYEGGVSYRRGTANGPHAIIDASRHLELYDEVLNVEPYKVGIYTLKPVDNFENPHTMTQTVYAMTKEILDKDKFIISIGGDHSITPPYCKALKEKYGTISVIHIDAHADLRQLYEGSHLSHACVMSRIRELTYNTLQLGLRSLSSEEAQRIRDENIAVCTMDDYRNGRFDLRSSLQRLPDPVFITFDVDVFDWSVIRSTGTPEPGGLLWDEALSLLYAIFSLKQVVGFDVVELIHDEHDCNSAFAAAKLIYKMIGFKFYTNGNYF